jgi:hypothetical protein
MFQVSSICINSFGNSFMEDGFFLVSARCLISSHFLTRSDVNELCLEKQSASYAEITLDLH